MGQTAPDIAERLDAITAQLKEVSNAFVNFGRIATDIMQTLHTASEELKNFKVASSSGLTKIFNQMKYGGA